MEDRTKVMIRARLRGAGCERDACIIDLSSRGLSASADNPPRRGDYVELAIGDISLVGQVKWSSMRRFGIAFRERVSVVAIMSGDGGAVTLQRREAVQKREARERAAVLTGGIAKKVEYAVIVAAGAAATWVVSDYAFAALRPLATAKVAMAGRP